MAYFTPFGDTLFAVISNLMYQLSRERQFPVSPVTDPAQIYLKLEEPYVISCIMEKNSYTGERTPEMKRTFELRINQWLLHQLQLNAVYGVYLNCGMMDGVPVLLASKIKDDGCRWHISIIWGDSNNWTNYVNCVRGKLNLR